MFHAKMIVEAHRGNIQVKSELDLVQLLSNVTFEISRGMKPTLLIVDDDQGFDPMKWALDPTTKSFRRRSTGAIDRSKPPSCGYAA